MTKLKNITILIYTYSSSVQKFQSTFVIANVITTESQKFRGKMGKPIFRVKKSLILTNNSNDALRLNTAQDVGGSHFIDTRILLLHNSQSQPV